MICPTDWIALMSSSVFSYSFSRSFKENRTGAQQLSIVNHTQSNCIHTVLQSLAVRFVLPHFLLQVSTTLRQTRLQSAHLTVALQSCNSPLIHVRV